MQGERAARRANSFRDYWGPRPGSGDSRSMGSNKKHKRRMHKTERQTWRRTQDDRTREAF